MAEFQGTLFGAIWTAGVSSQSRLWGVSAFPQHLNAHLFAHLPAGVSEVLDKFTDQEFTCEYK